MSVTITVSCDGMMCGKYSYIDGDDLVEHLPDDWSRDPASDFDYCPHCTKKMIESGELER